MTFSNFCEKMVGLKSEVRAATLFSNILTNRNSYVPYHAGKEVKKGLLQAILKQAKIKTNKR